MKTKLRFNIIDLLICFGCVILLLVVGVNLSKGIGDFIFTDNVKKDVWLSIRTELLSKEHADKFAIGQTVIDFQTGEELGIISDIKIVEQSSSSVEEHNSFYVLLDIATEAEFKGDHYMINGRKLLSNKITTFSVPELYFEGDVTSVYSAGSDG